ncbi:hypothetical protein [Sphingobacterium sp. LRF_L2]|uniref:hypothetical protein n=1 Tax=Sphingobacterium sp. LRF_L2 TaxID=3369421 RepID=UPI003F5E0620
MKKVLSKISQVIQVVLLAPIQLPGKALNVLKYIAIGLGIAEAVIDEEVGKTDAAADGGEIAAEVEAKEEQDETAQ